MKGRRESIVTVLSVLKGEGCGVLWKESEGPVVTSRSCEMGRREKGEIHSMVTSRAPGVAERVGVPGPPGGRHNNTYTTRSLVI